MRSGILPARSEKLPGGPGNITRRSSHKVRNLTRNFGSFPDLPVSFPDLAGNISDLACGISDIAGNIPDLKFASW